MGPWQPCNESGPPSPISQNAHRFLPPPLLENASLKILVNATKIPLIYQALERGELRAGSLVPIEVLGGNVFPCSPPPVPLFSGSLMSPLTRRPLDRYVGVTDRQVLELEAHRTRMNHVSSYEIHIVFLLTEIRRVLVFVWVKASGTWGSSKREDELLHPSDPILTLICGTVFQK